MRTSHFKSLTAAVTVALGLGAAAESHASAYAVSFNHIQNGFVAAFNDTNFNGVLDAGEIDASLISFTGSPASTSSSSATLNGSGEAKNDPSTPPDVGASNGTGAFPLRTNEQVHGVGGVGPTGVSYIMFGDDLGNFTDKYSSADARVLSEQDAAGTPIEAQVIAESNVTGSNFADAGSRNGSSTQLEVFVSAGSDCAVAGNNCIVSFFFDANPYQHTFLDSDAAPGSVARSVLATSATISTGSGPLATNVFGWAPDGAVGSGILGGTEVNDTQNLNATLESLTAGDDKQTSVGNAFTTFYAFSDALGTGEYTLGIAQAADTDVQRVPEPATLGLLGLGLAGIGFVGRRRRALAS